MFRLTTFHKQRFFVIFFSLLAFSVGIYLILYLFNNNIILYTTPSKIVNQTNDLAFYRLGGTVKKNSVTDLSKINQVRFTLYDDKNEIIVTYKGLLPSLFAEEQFAVVYGSLTTDNTFLAKELLAKHDETYKPKKTNS